MDVLDSNLVNSILCKDIVSLFMSVKLRMCLTVRTRDEALKEYLAIEVRSFHLLSANIADYCVDCPNIGFLVRIGQASEGDSRYDPYEYSYLCITSVFKRKIIQRKSVLVNDKVLICHEEDAIKDEKITFDETKYNVNYNIKLPPIPQNLISICTNLRTDDIVWHISHTNYVLIDPFSIMMFPLYDEYNNISHKDAIDDHFIMYDTRSNYNMYRAELSYLAHNFPQYRIFIDQLIIKKICADLNCLSDIEKTELARVNDELLELSTNTIEPLAATFAWLKSLIR